MSSPKSRNVIRAAVVQRRLSCALPPPPPPQAAALHIWFVAEPGRVYFPHPSPSLPSLLSSLPGLGGCLEWSGEGRGGAEDRIGMWFG